MQTGVPVAFGVLTTENIQQAVERAGTKAGNKGVDCAMTAMEMVNLFKGDSQKGIIIGKQGKALKKVATEARRELERFFGKTIYLETYVKVDKDWRSSDKELRNFGYQLD